MNIGRKLFIILLNFIFVVSFVNALNCGDIIYENTVLTNDLLDCSTYGLIMGNDGITLDCNNYTIDGEGVGWGIFLNSKQSITVKNCVVNHFGIGIDASHSNNHNITANIISNNTDRGINFYFSDTNYVSYNQIISNHFYGINMGPSNHNTIFNNIISNGNADGIFVSGSCDYNNFFNNVISNNMYGYGIRIHSTGSQHNSLWGNYFENNEINAFESFLGSVNNWNLSNIGNYWDDFETNPGFPDYYEIPGNGNGIDWYPIWNLPPVIEPIEDITVNESETVVIEVIATDPENDNLTYSINDSRFEQNENIFTWQTTYTDAGDYTFLVTVSDGWNNVDVEINVYVLDVPIEYYIDNSDEEFITISGSWNSMNFPNAYNEESVFNRNGFGFERAGWEVNGLVDPATYEVYVWKFEHDHTSLMGTNVHYMIYHRLGSSEWITVNQQTSGNEWVYLGEFEFDDSHRQGIIITDESDGYVIADAVKLVYTGPLSSLDSGGPELFD